MEPFSEIDVRVGLLDRWPEKNPSGEGGAYMFLEGFSEAMFRIAGDPPSPTRDPPQPQPLGVTWHDAVA